MAPGYEVETIMTLEEVFKIPSLFDSLMKGTSPTGPLTVPYARGKAQLGNLSKTGVSLTQSGDGK
ncbi:MAG: hypothetical protein K8F91_05925 [Candidatus Obscuribacterales bacterium]|nr:hypothetical protein [Candidatus Obscuribacterales bacterium]